MHYRVYVVTDVHLKPLSVIVGTTSPQIVKFKGTRIFKSRVGFATKEQARKWWLREQEQLSNHLCFTETQP